MGGKSKSQTTGFWYKMGLHMGLCHGPVDALLEIRGGDRTAWQGEVTESGSIGIDAANLYGGSEREGGIYGQLDVMMGEPTQVANDYLTAKIGAGRPAYRGILGLVFRGSGGTLPSVGLSGFLTLFGSGAPRGAIAANNPYIKPWAFRVRRILKGWKNDDAWYPEKAPILLSYGSGATGDNVWLAYDGELGDAYVGNYNGTVWTPLTTTLTLAEIDNAVNVVRSGNYIYFTENAYDARYSALPSLSAWSTATKPWSANGNIFSDGTYLYSFSSGAPISRMALPFGAWTDVSSADIKSYVSDLTLLGGVLYSISAGGINNTAVESADNGATWTLTGSLSAFQSYDVSITNNGSRLVVLYQNGAGGNCLIGYSDDLGATWTAIAYTFTSSTATIPITNGCRFFNGKFVAILQDGRCANSADGATWTTGTTVPRGYISTLSYGFDRIVAATNFNEIYYSLDHGSTWALMAAPVGSSATGYYMRCHWIGETPGGAYVPTLKAMNPAHIVYECLTNSEWGMGYDVSIIDTASFTAAADTFFAEGLGLCILWNRQDSIENFVKIVMDHCGAVLAEDRTTGLIKLKPIRGDYTVGSLPEFGSELGNVVEMTRFERASITDTINEVTVSYTDVATGKTGSVTVQNLAGVQASGRVISQSVDYPGLPTMDLAVRTAMRDLRGYTSGLARVHLTLNREGYALIPGNVIKFSWAPDGISQMVLRVITIDYGSLIDGKITIECLEDVFGLPATTYVKQQDSGWIPPDSTAQASPAVAVFEAPYRELLGSLGRAETQALADESGYLAGVAARAPGFNMNYKLRTRIGVADYADAGAGDWCPTGTLTAAITPVGTSIVLANTDGLDLIEAGSTAMLGSGATAEIVRVDAVDTDTSTITIARGCLDTVPKAWPIDTRFWAYDQFSAGAVTEYTLSEVVDAKFLTNTPTDLLSESAAPGSSVTFAQRSIRPYPPGKLRFDDAVASDKKYPELLYGAITTKWTHRDRLLQDDQVIDTEAASIGPEPSTTYTVRYYNPVGTLVNTESGITGASATAYTFGAGGTARITVEAVRAGYGSWQLHDHTFIYSVTANVRTTDVPENRITDAGDRRITE